MRKIVKTMKPIRKHIRNTASSQNLVLICSRQQKVAALQRGIRLCSLSEAEANLLILNVLTAEAPILWLTDAKSWLTGKDPDTGKDWKQEEKGMTEDEMVGWHHRLNAREFEQTPGDSEGQGSMAFCSPWVPKNQIWQQLKNNKCFSNLGWDRDFSARCSIQRTHQI